MNRIYIIYISKRQNIQAVNNFLFLGGKAFLSTFIKFTYSLGYEGFYVNQTYYFCGVNVDSVNSFKV